MLTRIALILIVIQCACAPAAYVDSAVTLYVQRWNRLYPNDQADYVEIIFGALERPNVGWCGPSGVTLDRSFWEKSSDLGREALVFHELGHCVLGLGHDIKDIVVNGQMIHRSLMYPSTFGETWMYVANRDYYLNQLRR